MFLNKFLAEEIQDHKGMYILHFGAYNLIVWKSGSINLHANQQFTNTACFSGSSLTRDIIELILTVINLID